MKNLDKYVGLDVHKDTTVIAVAVIGRTGAVRPFGTIGRDLAVSRRETHGLCAPVSIMNVAPGHRAPNAVTTSRGLTIVSSATSPVHRERTRNAGDPPRSSPTVYELVFIQREIIHPPSHSYWLNLFHLSFFSRSANRRIASPGPRKVSPAETRNRFFPSRTAVISNPRHFANRRGSPCKK